MGPGKKDGGANRRKEPRFCVPALAVYTDEGSAGREKLVNISNSGCCIATPASLSKGDHVLVHFMVSTNFRYIDDSFCLDTCVVWRAKQKENGYRYGMNFSESNSLFLINEKRALQNHLAMLLQSPPAQEN
jgi:hypothetical protein